MPSKEQELIISFVLFFSGRINSQQHQCLKVISWNLYDTKLRTFQFEVVD